MSVHLQFYRGGIVLVEATGSAARTVFDFIADGVAAGAEYVGHVQDAQTLWDQVSAWGENDARESAKIITATAFGTAATILMIEGGVGVAAVSAAAAIAGITLTPALLTAAVVVSAVAAGYYAGEYFMYAFDELVKQGEIIGEMIYARFGEHRNIDLAVCSGFLTAASTRPAPIYRDPLAIDLDGDGIETIGIGSDGQPVTFDHNADGVRTGTGWVTGDDAWLVIDRNGNGAIDSGRELFGMDYVKANNQFATSGLDALRDLDSNADGVFDASDAAFEQVRLWRDVNQDGISQASELMGLADQGIASIHLTGTAANTNLGNGNTVASTAAVTRTDGSTTTASDLHTAHNPFLRSFTSEVSVSEAALALPQMGGAGWVRDLREAMSLSEQQAQQMAQLPDHMQPANSQRPLIELVAAFAAAPTQAEQTALLDELIRAWAASNSNSSGNVDGLAIYGACVNHNTDCGNCEQCGQVSSYLLENQAPMAPLLHFERISRNHRKNFFSLGKVA